MGNAKNFSRIGVAYPSYVHIALEEFLVHRELSAELARVEAAQPGDEVAKRDLPEKLDETYMKVVIFAGLAVEAYIYDVAAIELTDKYVKTHLDKLSIVDKYVVVPRLISGKEVDKSGEWFRLLGKLVHQRNRMVHSKSRHLDLHRLQADPAYFPSIVEQEQESISAREAVKLLYLLTDEIGNIQNAEHHLPPLAHRDTGRSWEEGEGVYSKVYRLVLP